MPRIVNNVKKLEVRRDLRKRQTPEEILLWEELRNNKTGYKWRRQVSIGNYIADFYCREKMLVVELDGAQHLENKEYDRDREIYFKLLGIKTLRFWNNEVSKNLNGVITKILFEVKNRSTEPSPLQERVG